jgi:hypothetical protein
MDAERDPYRVLGVDPSADHEVIAAAYRVLARRHHPDTSASADSERRMAELNAAWAILRDDATREAWDREHLASRGGYSAGPEPTPPVWRGGGESQAAGPVFRRQTGPAPVGPDGRPQWRRGPGGEGAAGPPPGQPVGTVLPFGRHIGWSLGEVARVDPGYLTWLMHRAEGARYKAEIEQILRGEIPTGSGPLSANRPRWGKQG